MSQTKSFLEINGGAILERVDYELKKVIDNILDPNTPAKKARKVQLTITATADEDRRQIFYKVDVKPTLQPTNAIEGATAVFSQNGDISLVEMVAQVPGQMAVDGDEQREPDVIQFPRKQA